MGLGMPTQTLDPLPDFPHLCHSSSFHQSTSSTTGRAISFRLMLQALNILTSEHPK